MRVKGIGTVHLSASSRAEAYKKAYKILKDVVGYINFIEFKNQIISLREDKY